MSEFESYCPKTYYYEAILACILFLPLGIAALYYGKKTTKYYRHPDKFHMAVRCSRSAGSCAWLGIVLGIVFWASFYLIFFR